MRVLLTGGSGFVGTHLLRRLRQLQSLQIQCLGRKEIRCIDSIVCSDYSYKELSINQKIDVLVLLGNVTPKGYGQESFSDYLKNITSIDCLLHKIDKRYCPPKIVFASSVSVYKQNQMITENSPLNTDDPYGLSKIVCEQMLKDYCQCNGCQLYILRLGNIYGPGEEKYNKIVGSFIRKAILNETIELRSRGEEIRNLVYIDDVCAFLQHAIIADLGPQLIVNVVSRMHHSTIEIAQTVLDVFADSRSKIHFCSNAFKRNDYYDSTLFYDKWLKANPEIDFHEGVKRTAESVMKQMIQERGNR